MEFEQHPDSNNVMNVKAEDAQMNWAIEKARLTIGYFQESLQNPKAHQEAFSLKVKIEDEGGIEHIWLTDLSIDEDGIFYGAIDNEPVNIKSLKAGAKIGIDPDKISDWLIVEDGRMIGGYTIRVYRENLNDAERAAFDHGFGMRIDYGVDHFPQNMRTPEGAILCLEAAYSKGDVQAAIACKDFYTEAKMLLTQIPGMDENDQDLISQTAETLQLSFEAHLKAMPIPNFDNFERAFPEREFLDKDTVIVSEICFHPDGKWTFDRLLVTRFGDEWRVGPPVNDEE